MKIPADHEGLTSEWLTQALREKGTIKGASVSSFEAKVMGGQGIYGQIRRLSLQYDLYEEGAPRSLIAKFPSPDPAMRARAIAQSNYEREVRFYEEVADEIALRTPRCYYSAIDTEGGEYVLLLEDLAPARIGDRATGCTLEQADLAIRELAKFHAIWWGNPQLAEMPWLIPFKAADFQRFQDIYQQNWNSFLEKMGHELPDMLLRILERLGKNIVAIFNCLWVEPPQTLIHIDYHADNLFFSTTREGDLSLAVIDWQFVSSGPGIFDVANFLGGNMHPEDRKAKEIDILNIYYSILVENGIQGYTFDQCLYDYRLSIMLNLIRVVINIGAGGDTLYLNILWPRYKAAILDLNAGELLPS